MLSPEDIDKILHSTNLAASMYEAYTIRSISSETVSLRTILYMIDQEYERVGEELGNQIVDYIYSMIWCFSNTPVDEGDIIRIDVEKHTEPGKSMVFANPNLVGLYLFPLFLYGVEYLTTLMFVLDKDEMDVPALGFEEETFDYHRFISASLEAALQARYYHIRRCHFLKEFDQDVTEDLEGPLPMGKLVDPVEE